jgi:hypothetical protein
MMVNEAADARVHRGQHERIRHGFEQRVARIEIEVVEEALGESTGPWKRIQRPLQEEPVRRPA